MRLVRGNEQAINELLGLVVPPLYRTMLKFRAPSRGDGSRLFVDVGANTGQAFAYFKDLFAVSAYTYHFFEPNPYCRKKLLENLAAYAFPKGFEVLPYAAWVRSESLKFFGVWETGNELTQGGSLVREHNNISYNSDDHHALIVDAICFADYMERMQEDYDEIVIKMDIEGAELDVLESLWLRKSLFRRKTLMFVEFHSTYLVGEAKAAATLRRRRLLADPPTNVRLLRWY